MVEVTHARHDENGKTRYGEAGDQTGREVTTTPYYLHSMGWIVLRCINAEMRNKIADTAVEIANSPLVGYDQSQRANFFEALVKADFNFSKITKKFETDCSGLVRSCIACAYKKDLVGNIRTSDMINTLVDTGEFIKLSSNVFCKKEDHLKVGDILVTPKKGHTVIVTKNTDYKDVPIKTANRFKVDFIKKYKVSVNLNLRTDAGTNNSKILIMPKDLLVDCDGSYNTTSSGSKWLKIYVEIGDESFVGYSSLKYLQAI